MLDNSFYSVVQHLDDGDNSVSSSAIARREFSRNQFKVVENPVFGAFLFKPAVKVFEDGSSITIAISIKVTHDLIVGLVKCLRYRKKFTGSDLDEGVFFEHLDLRKLEMLASIKSSAESGVYKINGYLAVVDGRSFVHDYFKGEVVAVINSYKRLPVKSPIKNWMAQ